MRVKSHSLMLGYREYEARILSGHPLRLELEEYGEISELEYIKHGFKVVRASEAEMARLKGSGFK